MEKELICKKQLSQYENWQCIPETALCMIDNKYIVTDSGEVFIVIRKKIRKQKPRKHTNGYLRATVNGKDVYIHRLVAFCFIENPYGYNEISHEDNDKTNNNANNLKWCTRQYNNKKIFEDGIRSANEMVSIAKKPKIKNRKLSNAQVLKAKSMIEDKLIDTQIAEAMGCSRGTIFQIRKGLTYCE